MSYKYDMVTILGSTATGKTQLAAHLARQIGGEVLSADSRQIYQGMDIGTGKDLAEYTVHGYAVPYHLIDLVQAGVQYNVFEFQREFIKAYDLIRSKNKFPVLCGGSGLYLEAVLKGYRMTQVPSNKARREELSTKSLSELAGLLSTYKKIHNTSDIETKNRAIRAIEIEEYMQHHPELNFEFPKISSLIVGVQFDRDSRRERITDRLRDRLKNGLIEEVEGLLKSGLQPEALTYYGLEYKFVTMHVQGEISYDELFQRLNIAIHQFAKRQMTWFRKMEREGFQIYWMDGYLPMSEKLDRIISLLKA